MCHQSSECLCLLLFLWLAPFPLCRLLPDDFGRSLERLFGLLPSRRAGLRDLLPCLWRLLVLALSPLSTLLSLPSISELLLPPPLPEWVHCNSLPRAAAAAAMSAFAAGDAGASPGESSAGCAAATAASAARSCAMMLPTCAQFMGMVLSLSSGTE